MKRAALLQRGPFHILDRDKKLDRLVSFSSREQTQFAGADLGTFFAAGAACVAGGAACVAGGAASLAAFLASLAA